MGSPQFRLAIRDDKNAAAKVKQAVKDLAAATTQREVSRETLSEAFCARDRWKHIKVAIEVHHGGTVIDRALAKSYAPVMATSLKWNGYREEEEAACVILDLLPCLDHEEVISFIRSSTGRHTMKEVADKLNVTWDMREKYGLWQIGACDLTEREFAQRRAKKKNEGQKALRRQRGMRSKEEVAIQNDAKVAAVAGVMTILGKSQSTVYLYLKDRKIPPLPTDPNLISAYLAEVKVIADAQAGVKPSRRAVGKSATKAKSRKLEPREAGSSKKNTSGITPFQSTRAGLGPSPAAYDISGHIEVNAGSLTGLRPDAPRITTVQKKAPTVSGRSIIKMNFNASIDTTMATAAKAAASAPDYLHQLIHNAADGLTHFSMRPRMRRASNG